MPLKQSAHNRGQVVYYDLTLSQTQVDNISDLDGWTETWVVTWYSSQTEVRILKRMSKRKRKRWKLEK